MNMRGHGMAPVFEADEPNHAATARAALAFAHAHSVHQDLLVQACRGLICLMHIAFLLALVGLCLASLQPALAAIAASCIALAQRWQSCRLMRMLHSRQADVDWSQRRVLVLEQRLPAADRTLTMFKLYQDRKSGPISKECTALMSAQAASETQVANYFTTHASASRSKMSRMLDTMECMSAILAALCVVSSFQKLLA